MNEIVIRVKNGVDFSLGDKIKIYLENVPATNMDFKFFIGYQGIWNTLQEFSKSDVATWIPEELGKYIIMVQAKLPGSEKPFDYVSRMEYSIGSFEENLIKSIKIDKDKLRIGERVNLTVQSEQNPIMYRYSLKSEDGYEILKEYSSDNTFCISAVEVGKLEILVECKKIDSINEFDESQTISIDVIPLKKTEIIDFKCLTEDLVVDNELIFKVDVLHEDDRLILYKFIKISPDGSLHCIQDYSNQKIVSFMEKEPGNYRILCLVKDMYTPNEYDDRAVINYKVRCYSSVQIKSFFPETNSPQIVGSEVVLNAIVKGGKNLVFRYLIEGPVIEDSGYVTSESYIWNTKVPGRYKINLLAKDLSYSGKYEDIFTINYEIDEESINEIKIHDLILNKEENYVKNNPIRFKVIASGSNDLRYAFTIKSGGNIIESIDYGACNWASFLPKDSGEYELNVMVKSKYSQKEYDAIMVEIFNVIDYLPGIIEHVLIPRETKFLIGEPIDFQVIGKNLKDSLIKYIVKINNHKAYETPFCDKFQYSFIPTYDGNYTIEVYVKSKTSPKDFDSSKLIHLTVNSSKPVSNTKIYCNKEVINKGEYVIFTANSVGGKDIVYEFYLMENNDWTLVQKFSRKNCYSFIPFSSGKYKILVLSKSLYKVKSYEDYDLVEFEVE